MAKQTGGVPRKVEMLVAPVVQDMGLHLWDVRFEKEGADWYLKILVDGETPLDTDTCEALSRAIDPILDEHDPIDASYILEVGSPGLGRRLAKPKHFEAVKGEKIRVRLFAPDEKGRKELAGILEAYADGALRLVCEGEPVLVETKKISSAKLCDDENLFANL